MRQARMNVPIRMNIPLNAKVTASIDEIEQGRYIVCSCYGGIREDLQPKQPRLPKQTVPMGNLVIPRKQPGQS